MKQEENVQQEGRNNVPVVVSLLIYIVFFFILLGLFSTIAYLIVGTPAGMEKFTLSQYTILQIATLISSVVPAILVLKYVCHRPLSDLGLGIKGRGRDILWGMAVAVALYGVGFALSLMLGVIEVVGVSLDFKALASSWGFFVIVAFTEEIMIRGYILGQLLRTRMNKFLSLFISSVLFALLHIFNPNVAFLPMLNLVLAGCLLGVSFLYTRNLWFPISLHLFWNWIQGPVLGYEVSGTVLCPSLLQLHLPENNIINGGTFGFEGSIICTILMIALTGGIIYSQARTKCFKGKPLD